MFLWRCFFQFSSVLSLSHVRLCNPTDCSMPGFPVHHQLLELAETHVLWFGDGSFPMSQFFTSGDQSIGASASVLSINIQDWFPLGLTGLISLQSKGLPKSLLQHHSSKASILWCSAFFMLQLSYPYMTTRKIITLTLQTFVSQVMSLLFNILSRFVKAFLPRSNHLCKLLIL